MNNTTADTIENADSVDPNVVVFNYIDPKDAVFHWDLVGTMAFITHEFMKINGHWENLDSKKNSDLSCCLMGIVSELGEAYEALRCNKRINENDLRTYFGEWDDEDARRRFFEERIDNTYEVEVWDALSRILDLAGASIGNFARVAQAKREYNFTRPYKHGKEF